MLDFPDDGAIRFRKLRDAGSVLNATLAFVRRNARELVTSYLALVAPLAAASAISSVLFLSGLDELYTDPEAILRDPLSIFGPGYVIGVLLGALAGTVAQAAVGGYVRLYRQGQAGSITAGVLWDETRGLILPVLGVNLAFGAAVVGTALLNLIPCLGSIVWVVLLVWATPVISVALVSRLLETDSVGEAWTRARALVKGSWGFAFGALFLAALVLVAFSFVVGVVGAVLGVAVGVGTGFDPAQGPPQVSVATAVIQAVVGVLSYVIYLVPFVAAYFIHGRLAEELDGAMLHDDLDVLAEAGFDVPTPPALAPPPSTPPASAPPRSTPPSLDDAPSDADEASSDSGGFRGGGFGA